MSVCVLVKCVRGGLN